METKKVIEQPYFHEQGKILTEKIEIGKSIFKGYISCSHYTPMNNVTRGNLLIHESKADEVAMAISENYQKTIDRNKELEAEVKRLNNILDEGMSILYKALNENK